MAICNLRHGWSIWLEADLSGAGKVVVLRQAQAGEKLGVGSICWSIEASKISWIGVVAETGR